jgi:hypothetical protein
MPKPSKKKRRSQSLNAAKRHVCKLKNIWHGIYDDFNDGSLANSKGRSRTFEENRIVLLSLKMLLLERLELVEEGKRKIYEITWTSIEDRVSQQLGVTREHVTALRKQFLDDGDVLIFGSDALRGGSSPNYNHKTKKLNRDQLQMVIDQVDELHAKGKTVTNQLIRNFVRQRFEIELSKSTMTKYFKDLGLTYKPVNTKKRNIGAYRMDALRDFLILFNDYYKEWDADQENCPFVFVFTDESYIHRTHATKNSFVHQDTQFNRSSSKGERLIILHAITPYGPLCERIDGVPVSDLAWSGQTPHATPRADGLLTAELLWKASSRTGDYHDNMDSENFMNWVRNKLIPTFDRLHPGKQMVLVCDNAPYHHSRELGSLSSLTKEEVAALCVTHGVEYLDLPYTDDRYIALGTGEVGNVTIQDAGEDYCRIEFDPDEAKRSKDSKSPFRPTAMEFKEAVVRYLKDNKPELLECKVEKYLCDLGHSILWTPPYSPDLQPIELFWAAGKNHAAEMNYSGITMNEVVDNLHHGWYGNEHVTPENDENADPDNNWMFIKKKPVDCFKLFMTAIKKANEKFIPLCDGLSGTIGDLVVDIDHIANRQGLPIDMFVLSAARDGRDDDIDDDNDNREDNEI